MEDLMVGRQVDHQPLPNQQLLVQQLQLIDAAKSEKYCDLFVRILQLSTDK